MSNKTESTQGVPSGQTNEKITAELAEKLSISYEEAEEFAHFVGLNIVKKLVDGTPMMIGTEKGYFVGFTVALEGLEIGAEYWKWYSQRIAEWEEHQRQQKIKKETDSAILMIVILVLGAIAAFVLSMHNFF